MRVKRKQADALSGGLALGKFDRGDWPLSFVALLAEFGHAPSNSESLPPASPQDSLFAARIAEYRPLAIVSLLKSISKNGEAAAIEAGSHPQPFAVSFP